jgi:hypothetical protein
MKSSNDEDHDRLVNTIPIGPDDIIVDATASRTVCDEFGTSPSGGHGAPMPLSFLGRGVFDALGDAVTRVPGVAYAIEMDAHKFASQH